MLKAIFLFCFIWVFDLVMLKIIPISTYSKEFDFSCLVSMVFFMEVALCAIFSYYACANVAMVYGYRRYKQLTTKEVSETIKIMSVLTLLGIIFIYIDRVYIRGIDYSLGLRSARYQWFGSKGGSILSILGNLMSPLSYASLYLSIIFWEKLPRSIQKRGLICGIAGPTLHAMLNGGRSNILIMLFFCLIFCVFRMLQGKTFIPKMKMMAVKIIIIFMLLIIAVLLVYKGSIGSYDTYTYLQLEAQEMGGYREAWYTEKEQSQIFNMFVLMFIYAFHGQWHLADLLSLKGKKDGGTVLFLYLYNILDRFGLNKAMRGNAVFLNNQFLNLPGIFLYDLGWCGFVIATLLLGALFGVSLWMIRACSHHFSVVHIVFCTFVMLNVFFSPIYLGISFGYADFALYGLIFMGIYIRKKYGRRALI